jgi:hypothetical protein
MSDHDPRNHLLPQSPIQPTAALGPYHVPDTAAVPAPRPRSCRRAGAVKMQRPTGRMILTR